MSFVLVFDTLDRPVVEVSTLARPVIEVVIPESSGLRVEKAPPPTTVESPD